MWRICRKCEIWCDVVTDGVRTTPVLARGKARFNFAPPPSSPTPLGRRRETPFCESPILSALKFNCVADGGSGRFEALFLLADTRELSGPVLRDTARLSQRCAPIRANRAFRVSTWPLGCDTPFLFSERFPLQSMRSGVAIPPHKRGISEILARYPMMKQFKVSAVPSLRYSLERVLRDMGGILRWAAKFGFRKSEKSLRP